MTEQPPAAPKPSDQPSVFNASEGFDSSKLAERPNNLNATLSSNSLESKPSKLPGRRKIKKNASKPSVKSTFLKSLQEPTTILTALSSSSSLPAGSGFIPKRLKPFSASELRAQPGYTQQTKLSSTADLPAQATTESYTQTSTTKSSPQHCISKSSALPKTSKLHTQTKHLKSTAHSKPSKLPTQTNISNSAPRPSALNSSLPRTSDSSAPFIISSEVVEPIHSSALLQLSEAMQNNSTSKSKSEMFKVSYHTHIGDVTNNSYRNRMRLHNRRCKFHPDCKLLAFATYLPAAARDLK